jgi:GDP-4-dehydro-6-deoxy-D-mannose reductase
MRSLDLTDRAALTAFIAEVRPARVFHLAANAFVGPSLADPLATLNNNQISTVNLFESIRANDLVGQTRIHNAGSSDQYGLVRSHDLPIKEDTPFRPNNPYAVSKITQDMLGQQYANTWGLQIVNTRAFNHLGPRQNPQLAASAFARQIAQAEAGQIEPIIRVGNLDASRDYSDVRDVVHGYWLALASLDQPDGCQAGQAYNICSGRDYKMSFILQTLLVKANRELEVQTDPARLRPSDIMVIRGDYSRFEAATGWQPTISIETSLQDLLDYWRSQVKAIPAA